MKSTSINRLLGATALTAMLMISSNALAAATATCVFAVDAEPLWNEPFKGSLTIANTGDGIGFAPYAELFVAEGLTLAGATIGGYPATVTAVGSGPSRTNPLTGQTVTGPANSTLHVIELPIGSQAFSAAAFELALSFDFANAAAPPFVAAPVVGSCGYALGDSASGGTPITAAQTEATVTPQIIEIIKLGTIDPDVAGPVDPQGYAITIDVATGATVSGIMISDTLPATLAILGSSITGPGSLDTPTGPGGTLTASIPTITGVAGPDVVITVDGYFNEDTLEAECGDDAVAGGPSVQVNRFTATGITYNNLAQPDQSGASATRVLPLAITETLTPEDQNIPGTCTLVDVTFTVSDYFTYNGLALVSVLGDGLAFQTTGATFTTGGDANTIVADHVDEDAGVLTIEWTIPDIAAGETGVLSYQVCVNETFDDGSPVTARASIPTDQLWTGTITSGTGGGACAGMDSGTAQSGKSDPDIEVPEIVFAQYVSRIVRGGTVQNFPEPPTGELQAPPTVAPGDVVTFRVFGTLAAGDESFVEITDFLPLPKFYVSEIVSDATPSTSISGPVRYGPAHDARLRNGGNAFDGSIAINVDAGANSITWRWDDVETDPSQALTFDLEFDVTATTDAAAHGLVLSNLVNSASGSGTGFTLSQIVLDEPRVSLNKTRTSGNRPDAGDIATYRIDLTNSGGFPAYDIVVTDLLNPALKLPAGGIQLTAVRGDGLNLSSFIEDDVSIEADLFGSGLFFNLPDPASLRAPGDGPPGSNTLRITYQLEVRAATASNTVIPNLATLEQYTSEQTGDRVAATNLDYANRFPSSDNATVRTADFSLTKTVLAPASSPIQIGDTLQYRVLITVPEGGPSALRLTDVISGSPAHGTEIVVDSYTIDPSLTHTNALSLRPGATLGPDQVIDFGDITNNDRDDASPEQIELIYSMVVDDVSSLSTGTNITNRATVRVSNGPSNTFDTVVTSASRQVIEPDLRVSCSLPNIIQGGQAVTVAIDITHQSTTNDAYDLIYDLDVPANLESLRGLMVSPSPAMSTLTPGPGMTQGKLSLHFDSLAPGTAIGIIFVGDVVENIPWGSTVAITGGSNSLTYDTQDSNNPNDIARDYTRSCTASASAIQPTLSKALASPAPSTARIGDTIDYDFTLMVPAGLSPTIAVADNIPAGLTFVSAQAFANTEGILCDGIPCTLPTAAGSDPFSFTFVDVLNADGQANGDVDQEVMTWTVTARVNASANAPDNLVNSANVDAMSPVMAAGVTVIEPALTVSVLVPPTRDGDDDVPVTFGVENTGSATAYNVTTSVNLAGSGLELGASPSISPDPSNPAGCVIDATNPPNPIVSPPSSAAVLWAQVPVGATCDAILDAEAEDTIEAGETYTVTASTSYSSLPTDDPNERDYTATGSTTFTTPGLTVSKSLLSSTSTTTTDPFGAIGERMTYRVRIELPVGTSPNVILTDTAPGFIVETAAIAPGGNPGNMTGINVVVDDSDGPGAAAAIELGDVVNPADGTTVEDFLLIDVTGRVMFDPANPLATPAVNTVRLSLDGDDQGAGTAAIDYAVPNPVVTVTTDNDNPSEGDAVVLSAIITNAGAGPVCDTTMIVNVPSELRLILPLTTDAIDNDRDGATDETDEAALFVAPNQVVVPIVGCLTEGQSVPVDFKAEATEFAPTTPVSVTAVIANYASLPSDETRVTVTAPAPTVLAVTIEPDCGNGVLDTDKDEACDFNAPLWAGSGLCTPECALTDQAACDGAVYVSHDSGTISRLDRSETPYTRASFATATGVTLTALGFNPVQRYWYAVDPAAGDIWRIAGDGATMNLGCPEAEDGSGEECLNGVQAGDFLRDGTWVVVSDPNRLRHIDVGANDGPRIAETAFGTSLMVADLTLNPVDDWFYGVDSALGLISFDPSSGVADVVESGAAQAAVLYNAAGERSWHVTAADAVASCVFGLSLSTTVSAESVHPGAAVTYTHTLANQSADDATVDFAGALPPGLTYDQVSIVNPADGVTTYPADDSLAIEGLVIPAGDVITITVSATVADDAPAGSAPHQPSLSGTPGGFGGDVTSDWPASDESPDATPLTIVAFGGTADIGFTPQDMPLTLPADDLFANDDATPDTTIALPVDVGGIVTDHGTVTFDGTDFVYSPDPGYFGPDSFEYELCSPVLDPMPCAHVTVEVAVNGAPVGSVDDIWVVTRTASVTLPVSDDFADVDGDSVVAISVDFAPADPNAAGDYTVPFTVCDDDPNAVACTMATVVVHYNDPPSLPARDEFVVAGESIAFPLADILASGSQGDTATGWDEASLQVASGPCAIVDDAVQYDAPADAVGDTDNCYISVCEVLPGPEGPTTVGRACTTVPYTFVVTAPLSTMAEAFFTAQGGAVSLPAMDLLANDAGYDATTFNLPLPTSANGGTVSIQGMDVIYTPAPGFSGVDTYTYEVCEPPFAKAPIDCVTETVTVTVNAPPVVPRQTVWAVTGTGSADVDFTTFTDPEGHGLNDDDIRVISGPVAVFDPLGHDATSGDNATGGLTVTPADSRDPEYYVMTVEVCDDFSAAPACTTTQAIVVYNDPPEPDALFATVFSDDSYTRSVADFVDSSDPGDVDGTLDDKSVQVAASLDGVFGETSDAEGGGTCAIVNDVVVFSADASTYVGRCYVRLCEANPVADALEDQACSVVVWTFDVVDVLAANADTGVTSTDTAVSFDLSNAEGTGVLDNDGGFDPDADIAISPTSENGGAVALVGGIVTYTPAAGFTGVDTFTYTVCDGFVPANCEEVLVTVNVNGPPVADDTVIWVALGTPEVRVDIAGLYRDTDAPDADPMDGTSVNVAGISGTANATDPADGEAPGTVTVTPVAPGVPQTYVVDYSICDDDQQDPANPLCDVGLITVRYNDPPNVENASEVVLPGGMATVMLDTLVADTGVENGDDPDDGDTNGISESTIRVSATGGAPGDDVWLTQVSLGDSTDGGTCAVDPMTGDVVIDGPLAPGSYHCFVRICEELPAGDPGVCSVSDVEIAVPSGQTRAEDDAYVALSDTSLIIGAADGVRANDSLISVAADTATVTLVDATLADPATEGTVVLAADGSLTFVPVAGFAGTISFDYVLDDGFGQQDVARVTITINDPPTAQDVTQEVPENGGASVPLVDIVASTNPNTVDTGRDPANIGLGATSGGPFGTEAVTAPLGGTCAIIAGAVVYMAPANTGTGTDTCFVRVCETTPAEACDVATFTFELTDDFDPTPDSLATAQETALETSVDALLANDDTVDPDSFSLVSPTSASGGTVAVDPANGDLLYTPTPGACGPDSFTYTVCARLDATTCADVTVSLDVNCAPSVADQTIYVVVGTADVDTDIVAAFTDPDGDDLDTSSVAISNVVGSAGVSDDGAGVTTLDPTDDNAPGVYVYDVTACDDDALNPACTSATVVVVYNDLPRAGFFGGLVAQGDDYVVSFETFLGQSDANDVNGLLDPSSIAVVDGGCIVDAASGTVTYTAPATNGPATCMIQLCEANPGPAGPDPTGRACTTVRWDFTVVDQFEANPESYATTTGALLTIALVDPSQTGTGLLDNDYGYDIDSFAFATRNTENGGEVDYDPANGEVIYTPSPGFTGIDTFAYVICDVVDGTQCETVTITVNVNGPPETGDTIVYTSVGTPGVSVDVTPLFTDSDMPTPDPMDAGSVDVLAALGAATGTDPTDGQAPGSIGVTPDDPNVGGIYVVQYSACDDDQQNPRNPQCDSGTVTVVYNDPPETVNTRATVLPGASTTHSLEGDLVTGTGNVAGDDPSDGDTDALDQGGVLVATSLLSPDYQTTASFPGDGGCAVDPTTGEVTVTAPTTGGTYTCYVLVCEELPANDPAVCAVSAVTIDVLAGATTANDDVYVGVVGTPLVIAVETGLFSNDAVVSLGAPTIRLVSATPNPATQGTLTVAPDGSLAFEPADGFAGTVTFDYELCDGLGQCVAATATITINDAPTLVAQRTVVDPGASTTVELTDVIGDLGVIADSPADGDDDGVGPVGVSASPNGPFGAGASVGPADEGGRCAVNAAGDVVVDGPATPGSYLCYVQVCEELPANDPAVCSVAEIEIVVPGGTLAARDDAYVMSSDTALTVPVDTGLFANDAVNSEATPTITLVGDAPDPATEGTLTLNDDGSFSFEPVDGIAGEITFEYELCDDLGHCETAVVTILVNDPPVTMNRSVTGDPQAQTGIELVELAIGLGTVAGDDPTDGDVDGLDQSSVGVSSSTDGPFETEASLGDDGRCVVGATGRVTVDNPSEPGLYTCFVQICEEIPASDPRACAVTEIGVVVIDPETKDADDDGICDADESYPSVCTQGPDNCPSDANADQRDIDFDGTGDACDVDADGDGIPNDLEDVNGNGVYDACDEGQTVPDCDFSDWRDQDTDNDGLCDGPLDPAARVFFPGEPRCVGAEDQDADGLVDASETNPADNDTDSDALTDGEERLVYFTNPLDPDTDGGGRLDGTEVNIEGTDPLETNDDLGGVGAVIFTGNGGCSGGPGGPGLPVWLLAAGLLALLLRRSRLPRSAR